MWYDRLYNEYTSLQLISLPVDSEPDYFKQRPMFWARCSFLFHTQVQQIHTQNRKGSLFSPKEISAVLLMLQRKNISQIFQFPASIIPAGGWKIWNSISLYQTRVIFLCFQILSLSDNLITLCTQSVICSCEIVWLFCLKKLKFWKYANDLNFLKFSLITLNFSSLLFFSFSVVINTPCLSNWAVFLNSNKEFCYPLVIIVGNNMSNKNIWVRCVYMYNWSHFQ